MIMGQYYRAMVKLQNGRTLVYNRNVMRTTSPSIRSPSSQSMRGGSTNSLTAYAWTCTTTKRNAALHGSEITQTRISTASA